MLLGCREGLWERLKSLKPGVASPQFMKEWAKFLSVSGEETEGIRYVTGKTRLRGGVGTRLITAP